MHDEDEVSGVFDPPLTDEVPAEERGITIAGRYRIAERIGEGGMGQVLRVRHRRLGKSFALKLMRSELSVDDESRRTFNKEARLASTLSHPNIVSIVDFGDDPDWGMFLVMEFVEGEPLSKRIDDTGPLPIPVCCNVMLQLTEALDHSHDRGIVHADIKAENIMCVVDKHFDRRRWQVKLLDFGMAQLAHANRGESDRIAGTPEYMAPELISGGKPQLSMDIYALGVVLYEMLAGIVPFYGDTATDVLRKQLTDTPPPLAEKRGEPIDDELEAIVMRALAKDPTERYASAKLLGDDLRGYMNSLGMRKRSGYVRATSEDDDSELSRLAAHGFNQLPLPVAGIQADGTIVIANPAFARLVQKDLGELLESSLLMTPLSRIHPELRNDLRLVAMDGKFIRRRINVRRQSGESRSMRLMMSPMQGPAGDCLLTIHPLTVPR